MRFRNILSIPGPHLLRLAAWVWTGIVFLLCIWPADELPKSDIPLIDKWTHLVLFGGFNFLWLLSASGSTKLNRKVLFISFIAIVFGGLIELIQTAVPSLGRSGDLLDVLADAIGVLLAAMLYLLFCRLFQETVKKLSVNRN